MLTLPIQVGKSYKTRDGRTVTVKQIDENNIAHFSNEKGYDDLVFSASGLADLETATMKARNFSWDLVDDWQTGPIVEKTVKSLQAGVYGRFAVLEEQFSPQTDSKGNPTITMNYADRNGNVARASNQFLNADELEAAAALFTELATYLREKSNA